MRRFLLAFAITGCTHAPYVPVGVWTRDLGHGESQRILLFDSGVMGFQHVGAKLPISRAYGHWSRDRGGVRLDVVGVEPPGTTAPETIDLTRWTKLADPYGTSPGARDREITDERSWTYLVER